MTYTASELMRTFNEYVSYKNANIMPKWRLMRALYKGDFWVTFSSYLKEYTLTPDWNYLEYTIQAYQNSIYSGAFIGTVSPVNAEDEDRVRSLNAFIAYMWNKWKMKSAFLHIGENGELYSCGAVRIDWDSKNNHPVVSEIRPDELYLDPSVSDYKQGQALFIEKSVNINTLVNNPDFADEVKKFKSTHKTHMIDKTIPNKIAYNETMEMSDNQNVSLIECFIRNDKGSIDQVYILNQDTIIHEKLELPISTFPVVKYGPSRPDGDPYGQAKLSKILNTHICLNLLDSMEATQPYRILNRVRFCDVSGRLNMRAFADFGNTPGASFATKGNPRDIVSYVDVPTIPDMSNLKGRLENYIFQVTGVDPYYKGRMTNSLQTTGATQAFQARVTMLTDNSRITLLESFCEDITRMVLEYYFLYSADTVYEVPQYATNSKASVVGTHKVMFNTPIKFDYTVDASTLLPMNQANLFESAKILYEMQGQYGFKKQVVTEYDLVMYSDFPQKDLILQRLVKEDKENTAQTLIADLTNFASIFSKMLAEGLTEEQAAEQAIQILIEEKNQLKDNSDLGKGLM